MGKRFVRKLIALSICACLAAESLSYIPALNVRAEEVSGTEEPENTDETEHSFGEWKTTVKETVLKEGEKERICSICGKVEKEKIPKTPATIKVNMTTIRLKRKQSTTKFKVSGLVTGDSVKSYKSSNKKIFTVDKNGKICRTIQTINKK